MNILKKIKKETDERKLLSLAYTTEGDIKSGQITPEIYAERMIALAEKLGFPPTDEKLSQAADKYLNKGVK